MVGLCSVAKARQAGGAMRDLSAVPESDLDVMLAADNAPPHLLAEQDLVLN